MQDSTLSPMVKKADLCARLNVSERTLENMTKQGLFPPSVRIGKHVYWSERAVQNWQQQKFSAQEAWAPAVGESVFLH
ncbi:helix-turn-helix domain-containing protein [Paraburkholderia agricolaris]|uniref:helix-turn-helix transcriptional regulator n=1 Tax=Paraburkholderia agricolaris TaxID=2152888 RepID=UPI0038B6F051